MNFVELSNKRFTAKKFDTSKKIAPEDIAKLKEILRLSPSSVNSQPWFFVIGSGEEAKQRVRPAVADFNWPRIDTCSHFVLICVRTKLTEKFLDKVTEKELEDGRFDNAPEMAKIVNDQRINYVAYKESINDCLNWEKHQAYIALAALLYGAKSMGIDSTPIEGFDTARMDKLVNLDKYGMTSVLMVTLGYDAEDDHNAARPKSRLANKDLFFDLDADALG